jgi:hypothetical protein
MFAPTLYLTPDVDVIARDLNRTARPANRAEILARHLREQRGQIAPQQTVAAARIAHETPERPALLTPAAKVRRSLGRALVAAGHRLERQAA